MPNGVSPCRASALCLLLVGAAWASHAASPKPAPGAPVRLAAAAPATAAVPTPEGSPLFRGDGPPEGWSTRGWSDVARDGSPGARWVVQDGILRGSTPRGTWLISDAEYGDFVLEFEFRLAERGSSGIGLRFPPAGDPGAEGLVVRLVDPRYYGVNYKPLPFELSGALSRAVAPVEQTFLPEAWNRCSITCSGAKVSVLLNGKPVLEANLDQLTSALPTGRPLAERPRRGRIGFLELTRGDGQAEFRNVRLRVTE